MLRPSRTTIAASISQFLPAANRPMTKTSLSLVLLLVLTSFAAAQMRVGFGHGGFGNHGFNGGFGHGRGFPGGAAYVGDPFFYSDYYTAGSMASVPSQPIVIVQPSPSVATTPEPKSDPLMIELQGDHYVRLSGQANRNEPISVSFPAAESEPSAEANLPPAVLVYRDGHREEVSDYVIANGTLYSRTDYWEQGSWTKNIQLSALDIPTTIKVNQQSGVRFVLPSGPNEVVTRP